MLWEHLLLEQRPARRRSAQAPPPPPRRPWPAPPPSLRRRSPSPGPRASGLMPLTRMPCSPQLGGQEPHLMRLAGLGRAVGEVVGPGHDGVLADDVEDVPAGPLGDHGRGGVLGHEEGAPGHHVVLQVPVLARWSRASALEIDRPALLTTMSTPPKRATAVVDRRLDGLLVGDIGLDGDGVVAGPQRLGRRSRAASRSMSATTTAAPSSRRRMAMARPMPEPAPVTSATLPVSGFGLGRRRSLQLLQHPVLDAELLGLGDRRVRRQGLGAADRR